MSDWQPASDKDRAWALSEAAKPGGFMPNALSVAEFVKSLENEGLLGRSATMDIWHITKEGRSELARLTPDSQP